MTSATLIATLIAAPFPDGEELMALPPSVEWLELRADLVGDLDPDRLRNVFPGRILYSLRERSQGGVFDCSFEERIDRLKRAARIYDRVELAGNRDFAPEILDAVPVEKRLVSFYGEVSDLADLRDRHAQISSVPAVLYKLVTRAARGSDEFIPLLLLSSLRRRDTVAYSDGPYGFWSRLIAPHMGAPVVYGLVDNGPIIPSDPTIDRLIEDFGLPYLPALEEIYGIVGSQVFHSLSPRLHNAAYRAMNYPALFIPFRAESFDQFWLDVIESKLPDELQMPVKGLTVTSPHKESALSITSDISLMARQAESANILVRNNGSWIADTTDPEVVFLAHRARGVEMKQKSAAVIGCGGAGRAIATALRHSYAGVTLVNRSVERGRYAAELLGLPYIPLHSFSAKGYDIVVNATPVGRDDGELPFELETLGESATVIDLVYGSLPTPLITEARTRLQKPIDGRDVLLSQVLRQFRMMTGREMPVNLMRKKLGLELEQSDMIVA
jgi:3-dehydroquinate dehydratase/shikimate dehydrogenase